MKYLFLSVSILFFSSLQAQEENENLYPLDTTKQVTWGSYVERMPVFKGCEGLSPEEQDECTQTKINHHVLSRLVYPKEAIENGFQGTVWIEFEVLKSGEIGEVSIFKGIHKSLDGASMEAVKEMPNFLPGTQRGIPVNMKITFPIKFSIR